MDARAIIAAVRDGRQVGTAEMSWFAEGLASGAVSDAQAGAFAMAVVQRGLHWEGRTTLTMAMRDSGDTMHWLLDGPAVDKHSTGGVGDSISLLLAPALAACGAFVPMISGRGLGHTGGTLDKMETIPGFSSRLDEADFRKVVESAGCAIVSASERLAPADKRLYAVRDVTATVESIDLITASILSKKLAAGLDVLTLDVKCGSGAFMKTLETARKLAETLNDTSNASGCETSAVVSDMNQPLAPALGNALEVIESMRVLTGEEADGRFARLNAELCGICLNDANLCASAEEGAEMARAAIADGRAAERFGQMVAAMGGPSDFVENWRTHMPVAPVIRDFAAWESGWITAFEGEQMGLAVIEMGGGRRVESDEIDPATGLSDVLEHGAQVEAGDPILRIHARNEAQADKVEEMLRKAITIGDAAPEELPLILERI